MGRAQSGGLVRHGPRVASGDPGLRITRCASVLLAVWLTACDDGIVVCISAGATIGTTASVVAEVRDWETGVPAAAGATMQVRTATTEEWVAGSGSDLFLVWDTEDTGSFDITVTKPGYQDWHRHDVRLSRHRCGPGSAFLQVKLRLSN